MGEGAGPLRPLLALPLLALLLACGGSDTSTSTGVPAATAAPACQNAIRTCMQERTTPPDTIIDVSKAYTATIHTARGDIVLKLDPKAAPVTVNNFVYLSQNHYYDGLTFHRVEAGFVLQGGDPLGNGTGGPGYKLPNETNAAPWVKGSLAMASSSAGVSGSQFFILLGDAPHLATGGVYNHFGNVLSGQDVATAMKPGDQIKSIDIAAQ